MWNNKLNAPRKRSSQAVVLHKVFRYYHLPQLERAAWLANKCHGSQKITEKCPAEVQCWGLLFLSYGYKQNIMPGCAAFSGTDETGISLCGYKNLSNDCWTFISDKNVKRHYIKVFVQDLLFTLSQPTYLYEEWICNHKYFHVPFSSCDHLSYCKK